MIFPVIKAGLRTSDVRICSSADIATFCLTPYSKRHDVGRLTDREAHPVGGDGSPPDLCPRLCHVDDLPDEFPDPWVLLCFLSNYFLDHADDLSAVVVASSSYWTASRFL